MPQTLHPDYREISDGQVYRLADGEPVKVMGPVDPRQPVQVMRLRSYTRDFCSLRDLIRVGC